MGIRPLHNRYVSVSLEGDRLFCITYNAAIGILEGDVDAIKTAYEVNDEDGAVSRGRKVDSEKTLAAIVQSVKDDSEDIMHDIPDHFWKKYKDDQAVKEIRKTYNTHTDNTRSKHKKEVTGMRKFAGRYKRTSGLF